MGLSQGRDDHLDRARCPHNETATLTPELAPSRWATDPEQRTEYW